MDSLYDSPEYINICIREFKYNGITCTVISLLYGEVQCDNCQHTCKTDMDKYTDCSCREEKFLEHGLR